MKFCKNIFSVKNQDNYKLITVFGIKIKFKKFKYNQFFFLSKYHLIKFLFPKTNFNTYIITKFNVDIRYGFYINKRIENNPKILERFNVIK